LLRAGIRRELGLAVLFLALWILPPFWGIATLRTVNIQDDIFASDLWNDRLPTRAFLGASLRRGESPAWMPGIYTGFPSIAQVEIGALYPSNWILFGLLGPYTAFAWAQILPLWIAGLGTYWLARELGLPIESRLLASGVFSLCGFLVAHLRQLNMVDAAAWIPFLVLFIERIAAGRPGRAPLCLALLWALQLLAGHPQISYLTALVLGAYFAARRWQERNSDAARSWPVGRALASLVVSITLGTLLAAAQLVPAAELSRLTYREAGLGLAEATQFAASPLTIWTFFAPALFGDARDDSFRLSGLFWEQYGYLGLLPALLAIVGLVAARNHRHARVFAALAALSYLLVLGKNTPVFGWAFAVVPGMRYFRFPTRFLVFVELGLALLAAFGLAAMLEKLRGARRSSIAALVIAVTAADLWIHQMRQVPQVERERWLSPIGTEQFLSAARARGGEPWRYYTLDASLVHVQTYHAAKGWSGDLTPYVRLRALLQPSFNLLFGLEAPDGYSNLVPRHYESVWGSEKQRGIRSTRHLETGELEPQLATMLRLFNVRYVLTVVPLRSSALRPVAQSSEGVQIYEVDDPLPRAFVVGRVLRSANDEEALGTLTAADFDPASRAVIVGADVALPANARPSRNVRVIARSNGETALRASLEHPGLLVLSEGHYPGWRVTVDGEPAALLRVNVMMRGVVVPAGEHDVVFHFRSNSLAVGLLLSAVAIVALAGFRRRLAVSAAAP